MIKRCLSRSVLLTIGGLLLLALFLLPSSQVFASSSQAQRPASDFSATCTNLNISSSGILTGKCRTAAGGWLNSPSLNLNSHIGNINAKLVPDSSGFAFTCVSIFGSSTLIATCLDHNQNYVQGVNLDLDPYISNLNGKLTWAF
jgi:CVNH domain